MTKAQRQDLHDCQDSGCKYLRRCRVYWGRKCNRQGGRKVPRIRVVERYRYTFAEV
ncbi:MAG: hypothetical protein KBA08_12445 [Firmicutes bacterium]|nr:hypothetical protein [Bacillota bacterium]